MRYNGDTKRMAIFVKNILLGYLEMWIFSIRLVFTAWCVTISVFWSITLGSIVELTNYNKLNIGVSGKKRIKDADSLNTRKPHPRNGPSNVIAFGSKIKMCHSHSRNTDKRS